MCVELHGISARINKHWGWNKKKGLPYDRYGIQFTMNSILTMNELHVYRLRMGYIPECL